MTCPHYDIAIVQRSKGKSVVAAAAYQSGQSLFSEYDKKRKSYAEKHGIVHTEIMLPPNAPQEYADRETLWNAVEKVEKNWNSQLARRFIMALPVELSREEQIRLMEEYCQKQFVSKGMIADIAIHDKGDGNPHAHVLLTLRPMDKDGRWMDKSHKVTLSDAEGNPILDANGNPKTQKINVVDWNDQKYGEIWRHEWEIIQNQYLEKAGRNERVDLRSFERQGKEDAPQIHLGPEATAMERRGERTILGDWNREIKRLNNLRRAILEAIKSLKEWLNDIGEKIRREAMIEKPEDQNLADVLACYMEIRKDERADWSKAGQNKGQIHDLKRIAHSIAYLRENDIATVAAFKQKLDEINERSNELRSAIRNNDKKIGDIDSLIDAIDTVKRTETVHQKYETIHWKSRKEKYREEHADELKAYARAIRIVNANQDKLPINRKAMRNEQKELQKLNEELTAELESIKAETEELKQVKYYVQQAVPEELGQDVSRPGKKPSVLALYAEKQKLVDERERQKQRESQHERKQNMQL